MGASRVNSGCHPAHAPSTCVAALFAAMKHTGYGVRQNRLRRARTICVTCRCCSRTVTSGRSQAVAVVRRICCMLQSTRLPPVSITMQLSSMMADWSRRSDVKIGQGSHIGFRAHLNGFRVDHDAAVRDGRPVQAERRQQTAAPLLPRLRLRQRHARLRGSLRPPRQGCHCTSHSWVLCQAATALHTLWCA